jgi:hypothetical protein
VWVAWFQKWLYPAHEDLLRALVGHAVLDLAEIRLALQRRLTDHFLVNVGPCCSSVSRRHNLFSSNVHLAIHFEQLCALIYAVFVCSIV